MHGSGFSLGFFGCLSPGCGRVLIPFARCGLVLIGRIAWWPVVGFGLPVVWASFIWFVCLGNCCSCFGLLPFSYVYRGGAVSFLVSKGTCYLFLLIVCGALPFWKKFLIIQKKK